MNIYILHQDASKAAIYHNDQHIKSQIAVTLRLLSTKHDTGASGHPCHEWSRRTLGNWLWLQRLGVELLDEHYFRFCRRQSRTTDTLMRDMQPPDDINPSEWLTPFVQHMPDKYQLFGRAVEAYRNYYISDLCETAKYTHTNKPSWLLPPTKAPRSTHA